MEIKESRGINKQNISKSKVVIVYDHMNESSRAHTKVGLTTLMMVE